MLRRMEYNRKKSGPKSFSGGGYLYLGEMRNPRRHMLATLSFIASSSAMLPSCLNGLERNRQLYEFIGEIAFLTLTSTSS